MHVVWLELKVLNKVIGEILKVWAVANQKGGVAKTTTVVSLAGHLVKRGLRCLLIDLDPHGSLTSYFKEDPDSLEKSVYNLFQMHQFSIKHEINDLIIHSEVEGIDFIPASISMATLDRQLGTQEGKGLVIKKVVDLLADEYDYILIDCPPVLGVLMVNALAACTHVLVPVQTEFLALKGLERMHHTLNMIIQARRHDVSFTIVPVMFDRRTRASTDSLRALREKYGAELWQNVIPVDTAFRTASQKGLPLPIMLPSSRGAKAYAELLDNLLNANKQSDLKRVTNE